MATRTKTVFGLGDSNAAGCGSPDKQGWLQLLRSHYYDLNQDLTGQRLSWFYDLSLPGETAASLLTGITANEVARRDRERRPTLSIVSIGGQQTSVDLGEKRGPDLPDFARQIGRIATALYGVGDVMYVGIPSPDIERMKDLFAESLDGYSFDEIQATLREYESTAMSAITASCPPGRHAMVVPVFDITAAHPEYDNYHDAVHPNHAGHRVIFEHVRPFFDEMVELDADMFSEIAQ